VIIRNRTLSQYIGYDLYLKFSGLSLRRVSQRLSCFIKRNQVSIWNWFKNTNHKGYLQEEKKYPGLSSMMKFKSRLVQN